MYMPGRLRTASRPFSTLMEFGAVVGGARRRSYRRPSFMLIQLGSSRDGVHANAEGASLQVVEQRFVGSREEGLQAERLDFVEERGAPERVQMRRDLVQQ